MADTARPTRPAARSITASSRPSFLLPSWPRPQGLGNAGSLTRHADMHRAWLRRIDGDGYSANACVGSRHSDAAAGWTGAFAARSVAPAQMAVGQRGL